MTTPHFNFQQWESENGVQRDFGFLVRSRFQEDIHEALGVLVPETDIRYVRFPIMDGQWELTPYDEILLEYGRHYLHRSREELMDCFITVSYARVGDTVVVGDFNYARLNEEQHQVLVEEHLTPLLADLELNPQQPLPLATIPNHLATLMARLDGGC